MPTTPVRRRSSLSNSNSRRVQARRRRRLARLKANSRNVEVQRFLCTGKNLLNGVKTITNDIYHNYSEDTCTATFETFAKPSSRFTHTLKKNRPIESLPTRSYLNQNLRPSPISISLSLQSSPISFYYPTKRNLSNSKQAPGFTRYTAKTSGNTSFLSSGEVGNDSWHCAINTQPYVPQKGP